AESESEAAETESAAPETEAVVPEVDGVVVNACIASEPETIDPGLISSVDGSTYTQHQFENLMKYAQTGEAMDESGNIIGTQIVPGQAADYPEVSEDQTVYTFTLRDDIFWSDGEPVEAEDFVYAWRRVVDPATASEYGYFLDGIVLNASAIQAGEKDPSELGIEAVDAKTLKITLESPCAYFLEVCAFASLMPLREDVVEAGSSWTDPENIVVNGPYKVTKWVHDSYIQMEKNDKYYDYENLGPDAIVWWLSDSEDNILQSYQSGAYNFIDTIAADMIESLKASGDCFVLPYVGTYYLYLNCTKVTDWRVRAAMTLSIDRENIVNNVTKGGQVPATGLVAAGILDSTGTDFSTGVSELGAIYNTLQAKYPDADLSTYSGRCELAQELYNEAVEEGAWDPNTTIVYNFNTSDTHKAIAEACGSDWEDVLGLSITTQNQEWATYTNGLGEGTFGVARLGWIADYNDPVTYLELFTTGNSYNYGSYSDANFDEKIASAKTLLASTERDALLYEAEETLFGEGGFPVCPVYYYTQLYCMKGWTNVGFTSFGYFFFTYAQPAE
ncbi:MAG: peptide ABC transporter substrate-binding protein, partial [Lachnospiraceae bacterium]|nr:peptide ABC transporter substrate-binding protein [Lachnospiraceae bacterium]